MEDVFSVAYQQTEDELDLEYAFFGIYDGHGGKEAALFAKVANCTFIFIKIFFYRRGRFHPSTLSFSSLLHNDPAAHQDHC